LNSENQLESRGAGAVRRRFAVLFAATAFLASVGAGTALAQGEGGATAPGDPAAPTVPVTPGATGAYIFPVAGPHTYGEGFGAARSGHTHQGQDVLAACGTPLVAVSRSRVIWRRWQAAAGNYVVLKDLASKQSYMYAHLAAPAAVTVNQLMLPGQQLGIVGETGDATACHLHFEIWTKKGYYRGGHPFNPLATLLAWDPTH
jgi:murein DD-endopeptidase MepM/ murein hydrolase activator NlpD